MANAVWELKRRESQSYPAVKKSLRYSRFSMDKLGLFLEKIHFLGKNNGHWWLSRTLNNDNEIFLLIANYTDVNVSFSKKPLHSVYLQIADSRFFGPARYVSPNISTNSFYSC